MRQVALALKGPHSLKGFSKAFLKDRRERGRVKGYAISLCTILWQSGRFIPIPKKGNAKECSNYCSIALISHASQVMLKILQARLQQYISHELPDVQAEFRKARRTRDQIANICWITEKARECQKNIYFCFTDYAKTLTAWITTNYGKFLKRWEY